MDECLDHFPSPEREKPAYAFSMPGTETGDIYMCLVTGKCCRVDKETDNLTEEEIYKHWDLVEEADRKELKLSESSGRSMWAL